MNRISHLLAKLLILSLPGCFAEAGLSPAWGAPPRALNKGQESTTVNLPIRLAPSRPLAPAPKKPTQPPPSLESIMDRAMAYFKSVVIKDRGKPIIEIRRDGTRFICTTGLFPVRVETISVVIDPTIHHGEMGTGTLTGDTLRQLNINLIMKVPPPGDPVESTALMIHELMHGMAHLFAPIDLIAIEQARPRGIPDHHTAEGGSIAEESFCYMHQFNYLVQNKVDVIAMAKDPANGEDFRKVLQGYIDNDLPRGVRAASNYRGKPESSACHNIHNWPYFDRTFVPTN